MRIEHHHRIRPGDEVEFRYDRVGPVISGVVIRVSTTYIVDRYSHPELGVTVLTVKTAHRVYEDITFDELVDHEDKWHDEIEEVHGLAGTMKPGFEDNGFTVKRVIFHVIEDPTILDGMVHVDGFCYVETPSGLIQKRSFDQVGV